MSRAGSLAVSAAAVLWAGGAIVAGRMFDRGAAPVEVTAARAWIAAAGIGLIALARRAPRRATQSGTAPGPGAYLVVAFGLSIAAANFFYYAAISRVPVAVAIVVQYTAPGMVVAWHAFAGRRPTSRRVWLALGAAFAGVVLLSEMPSALAGDGAGMDAPGIAFAVASAVAFAVYMITGERVGRRYGPDGALARGFMVASLLWIVVIGARGRPDTLLDATFAPGIAFVAVGATIVPFLLFLWGLARVGAQRASIISMLEPLAGALFALAWLDQSLTAAQIGGGLLVVAGIGVVQTERPGAPEAVVVA